MNTFTRVLDGYPIPGALITDDDSTIRQWIDRWLYDWGVFVQPGWEWISRRTPGMRIGSVGYSCGNDFIAGCNFTGMRMVLPDVEAMTRPDGQDSPWDRYQVLPKDGWFGVWDKVRDQWQQTGMKEMAAYELKGRLMRQEEVA